MTRWIQLIEDDHHRLSMRALITYIVTFTLCGGILAEVFKTMPSEGIVIGLAGILSTLVGIIYGVGKVVDGSVMKAGINPQPLNVEAIENVNITSKDALENNPDGGSGSVDAAYHQPLEGKGKPTGRGKRRAF